VPNGALYRSDEKVVGRLGSSTNRRANHPVADALQRGDDDVAYAHSYAQGKCGRGRSDQSRHTLLVGGREQGDHDLKSWQQGKDRGHYPQSCRSALAAREDAANRANQEGCRERSQ
jgi:hypothetical protein